MAVLSIMTLYYNSVQTMTEEKVLLKNWQHKDIKLKDLIDKRFQLPNY